MALPFLHLINLSFLIYSVSSHLGKARQGLAGQRAGKRQARDGWPELLYRLVAQRLSSCVLQFRECRSPVVLRQMSASALCGE